MKRVSDDFEKRPGVVALRARRELLDTVVDLLDQDRPSYVVLSRGLVLAYTPVVAPGRARLVASRKGQNPSDKEDVIVLDLIKKSLAKLGRRTLSGIAMEPELQLTNRSGSYGMTVFTWFEVESLTLGV